MKTISADLAALWAAKVPCSRIDLFAIGPCLNGSYIYATNGQLAVRLPNDAFVYTGTGSASASLANTSAIIPVIPGATYTLSAYIDATHVTSGTPVVEVWNAGVTTLYEAAGQTAGAKGFVSGAFTVPGGVTQVVVLFDTDACTVASGQPLIFSNPQLVAGSARDLTGALYNLAPDPNLLSGSEFWTINSSIPIVAAVGFGNTYQPSSFGSWSRGDITVKIGLESNSCDLTVFADNQVPVYFPGTSNAALLLDGIKFGLLGDAGVTISTLYNSYFLAGYAAPALVGPTGGSLIETKFVGMVAPISQIGLTKAVIEVRDMMYLLNTQVPCRLIQASCSHVLYDVGCTLAASAFTRTGTVASLTYPYLFSTSAHIATVSPAGTFAQGILKWLTGANAGLSSFVRAWTPGGSSDAIQLDVAPIFPIAAADTFSISQGCNKTLVACTDFQGATDALINFGGQPNTPVPETAIG